jgi:NADH dehydrogenase/NADH:ubiquinone oxidoreductase subunit G
VCCELKILTQENLFEIMQDPDKVINLMKNTNSILYQVVQYSDIEMITKSFESWTKLSKRQLLTEGLMLLGKLPFKERCEVLESLQKFNIPGSIWYKILEENIPSITSKEPIMTPTEKATVESEVASFKAAAIAEAIAEAKQAAKQAAKEALDAEAAALKEELKLAGKTFWANHGNKITNISLMFLGAAIGIVGKSYSDTHKVTKVAPGSN